MTEYKATDDGAAEQSRQQKAAQEKARAELNAQAKIQHDKADERAHVGAATEDVIDAVEQHLSVTQAASHAEAEADRLRQRADILTDHADLP